MLIRASPTILCHFDIWVGYTHSLSAVSFFETVTRMRPRVYAHFHCYLPYRLSPDLLAPAVSLEIFRARRRPWWHIKDWYLGVLQLPCMIFCLFCHSVSPGISGSTALSASDFDISRDYRFLPLTGWPSSVLLSLRPSLFFGWCKGPWRSSLLLIVWRIISFVRRTGLLPVF